MIFQLALFVNQFHFDVFVNNIHYCNFTQTSQNNINESTVDTLCQLGSKVSLYNVSAGKTFGRSTLPVAFKSEIEHEFNKLPNPKLLNFKEAGKILFSKKVHDNSPGTYLMFYLYLTRFIKNSMQNELRQLSSMSPWSLNVSCCDAQWTPVQWPWNSDTKIKFLEFENVWFSSGTGFYSIESWLDQLKRDNIEKFFD